MSFILFINLGPKTNEKNKEVKVAKIALVERNSTTLNGPKNSLRYSNTGNNMVYTFNLSATISILVDLEPFTSVTVFSFINSLTLSYNSS